jgi:hypothetical protein
MWSSSLFHDISRAGTSREDNDGFSSDAGCTELLLDALSYEALFGRLSSEMEQLVQDHLRSCSPCRRKVLQFRSVLCGKAAGMNCG